MTDLDRTPRTEVTDQMVRECRRDLPPVKVLIAGNTVWARTSGRLNDEATVTVTNTGTLHSGNEPWWDYHFAWKTVCRAIVSGTPLRV